MGRTQVEELLVPGFPNRHVNGVIRHFEGMTKDFQREEWEDCIAKGGKFVEAVLKALTVVGGQTVSKGKDFKVDKAINILAALAVGSVDDTVRLTIPRSCRFVYEIASNRGGRHDPDEIDPNEMDAVVVMGNCSWILAEMIRHAQHGAVDMGAAKNIVNSLVTRKYPLVEEVDGRAYFHLHGASATDIALVALNHSYPSRIAIDNLVKLVQRHGFSENNARVAVRRIMKFVDEDENEQLRLLVPGVRKAEQIMDSHLTSM